MKKSTFVQLKIFTLPLMAILIIVNYLLTTQVAINASPIKHEGTKSYKPRPGRKRTQARKPGGARGNSCNTRSQATLALLVPEDHIPLTTESHPTFLWYVNTTSSVPIRLTIYEPGQTSPIYVQNWSQSPPGIVAFKLPATANPLKIGKQYRWTVSVICNPQRPSENIYAKAWIERVEKPTSISNNCKQRTADSVDSSTLGCRSSCLNSYAESGIWYDALSCEKKLSAEFWSLLDQVELSIVKHERPLITLY